jgi:hypothetical protein
MTAESNPSRLSGSRREWEELHQSNNVSEGDVVRAGRFNRFESSEPWLPGVSTLD